MKQYIIDPELEKCLPPLDEGRYQWIKDQIATKGYEKEYPIVVWKEENVIVDGHHRYKACIELGKEPVVFEKSFESIHEAIIYAIDHQENRRNLSETQRAAIIVKRDRHVQEESARKRQLLGTTPDLVPALAQGRVRDILAEKSKTSHGTIDNVKAVVDHGIPELETLMMRDELKAEPAKYFAMHTPKEEQSEVLKHGGVKAVLERGREIRKELKADRDAQKRAEKEAEERAKEKAEIKKYKEVLKEQFGDSRYSCSLSSVFEMWCNSCKCAFDIFKPMIAKCCPACASDDIEKRDESWYPGKKVD